MAVLVPLLGLPVEARAQVAGHEVVVRDTSFQPAELQIDPGDTVTWRVQQDDHTITSEDGDFDFRVDNGDVKEFTFPKEGTFRYLCQIHASMRGVVRVGDGCAGECVTRCPDCDRETRNVPSLAFPTVQSALDGAPPKALITVRPGHYDVSSTLVVSSPGVGIRGVTASGSPAPAGSVVLRGSQGTATGIRVTASGASMGAPVSVENVTLTGFLETGLAVEGSEHFVVSNVRMRGNGSYGLRTTGSINGQVRRLSSFGHQTAGISIESCDACGVLVEKVHAKLNAAGFQTVDASGIVVRGSVFEQNANGMVLKSASLPDTSYSGGVYVYGNSVRENGHPDAPAPSVFDVSTSELPAGTGIWLQGGAANTIENNVVAGNHYGVVVTSAERANDSHHVLGNELSGNQVDLAWDGVGRNVCFADNAHSTAEPAGVEELYPCGRAATVGFPYPKVTADLVAFAYRTYFCEEVEGSLCI